MEAGSSVIKPVSDRLPQWARPAILVGAIAVAGLSLGTFLYNRYANKVDEISHPVDLLFGGAKHVDARHAKAVLEVVRHNMSVIQQRISTLRQRAIDAGLIDHPIVDGESIKANPASLTGQRADGYYYFSSDGKRLKTKWDTFDVEAALAEVDDSRSSPAQMDEMTSATSVPEPATSNIGRVKPAYIDPITISALKTESGGISKACETCLEDMDTIQGNITESQRQQRKQTVNEIHSLLAAVDDITAKITTVTL